MNKDIRSTAGLPVGGQEGAKQKVRRVIADAAFEAHGFMGWSTPQTFNEAAAGSSIRSAAHGHSAVRQDESPSQRPTSSVSPHHPSSASPWLGTKPPASLSAVFDNEVGSDGNNHNTRTRASATRHRELTSLSTLVASAREPLNVRNKRFVEAGSRIVAHSPKKPSAIDQDLPTRLPAVLKDECSRGDTRVAARDGVVACGETNRDDRDARGKSARGSSAASESSQRRLLSSAASSNPEDEVQLCAAGFGERCMFLGCTDCSRML